MNSVLNSRLADSAYINNGNLDSYITPGFYSFGSSPTNAPDSQTWFSMIVIGPSSASKQIVIARNNAIYKVRFILLYTLPQCVKQSRRQVLMVLLLFHLPLS